MVVVAVAVVRKALHLGTRKASTADKESKVLHLEMRTVQHLEMRTENTTLHLVMVMDRGTGLGLGLGLLQLPVQMLLLLLKFGTEMCLELSAPRGPVLETHLPKIQTQSQGRPETLKHPTYTLTVGGS